MDVYPYMGISTGSPDMLLLLLLLLLLDCFCS
jgi:hypothetical protein